MKARVLIVDDDVLLARALRSALSGSGCECGVAHGRRLALDALERQPFDVALLDVELGADSGVELAREIALRWPRMVRILMSGIDPERLAVLASSVSVDGFVSKPFSVCELGRWLDRESSSSGTRSTPGGSWAASELPQALARSASNRGG